MFISNGYPPERWAGTETYTASLAQALQKRGYDLQVLCAGKHHESEHYFDGYTDSVDNGIPVRRLHLNWTKAPDPFLYLYNSPVIADYLGGYLAEVQPDIVHVTSCERLSASVLSVVKEAGIPLLLSLTDFWFLCPRITLLRGDQSNCDGRTTAEKCISCLMHSAKAYRWPNKVLPEASLQLMLKTLGQFPIVTRQPGVIGMLGDLDDRKAFLQHALTLPDRRRTASAFVRDVFVNNGVTAPITVEPYGHALDWLDSYSEGRTSDKVRFGFIGHIAPSKGVHLLLEAAKMLQDDLGDQFSLHIYGNINKIPGYFDHLQALAVEVAHVEFCGTYTREDSGQVYGGFDVMVVPSLWYDFPLVIYEAFATGTPVIATNLGGMAEAVEHNVSGLLFERDNALALAEQMRRIIMEESLLDRLQAGIPPVKTVDQEIDEIEAMYQAMVLLTA